MTKGVVFKPPVIPRRPEFDCVDIPPRVTAVYVPPRFAAICVPPGSRQRPFSAVSFADSVDIQEQERRDRDRRRQMMDTPNTFNDMMYDEEAYESLDVGDDESEYGLRQGQEAISPEAQAGRNLQPRRIFLFLGGTRPPTGEQLTHTWAQYARPYTGDDDDLLGKSPMMTA